MICPACGAAEVEIGAECPMCWEVAVARDALDSLLSSEAEVVDMPLEDEPTTFTPLEVRPGVPIGPHGTDDSAWPPSDPAREVASFEVEVEDEDEDRDDSLGHEPPTFRDPAAVGPDAVVPILADPGPVPPSVPPPSTPSDLPRRRALDATEPQWGARDHPPAVMAPPPPAPLDAPAVTRTKAPSGTGLPAPMRSDAPLARPDQLAAAPASEPSVPGPSDPVPPPEPETHPRVRRWFGRGTPPAPGDQGAVASEPVPPRGAFDGAPDGLLDGVVAEPDLGDAVVDPAGVEDAASRLSAGARRTASAPLAVVAAILEDGERAEAVVQGEYQHRPGVAVLTDRRLIVANDRRWTPDVRVFAFDDRLVVHGWQDDRRATIVLVVDGVGVVLSGISDRPLARDLAGRVRARIAGEPGV